MCVQNVASFYTNPVLPVFRQFVKFTRYYELIESGRKPSAASTVRDEVLDDSIYPSVKATVKEQSVIIEVAQQRLHPGGRLVINLATLENLHTARALLAQARLVQVQINRAVPILEMLRFEALNPIFMVTWCKRGEEK